MDKSMNVVLKKHEYEYLQAYNIHVKRKEGELRELIQRMNERHSDTQIKDQKIHKLEKQLNHIRRQVIDQGVKEQKLTNEVKYWRSKFDEEKAEKQFFHKSALDTKKKNQLLKIAIQRLQCEYDELKTRFSVASTDLEFQVALHQKIKETTAPTLAISAGPTVSVEEDPNTFMTKVAEKPAPNLGAPSKVENGLFPSIHLRQSNTEQQEFFVLNKNSQLSIQQDDTSRNRRASMVKSVDRAKNKNANAISTSRYRQGTIPTSNLRFEQFCDIVFGSKMTKEEIRREVQEYVQVLETNYAQKIDQLKLDLTRERHRNKGGQAKQVHRVSERSDLEELFVSCVEDVRRDVMRRRLQAEI